MLCYQCQETAKNEGCTIKGVCGKTDTVADLQDLLIYVCKGIAIYDNELDKMGVSDEKAEEFVMNSLFMTVTNTNFDEEDIIDQIRDGLKARDAVRKEFINHYDGSTEMFMQELPEMANWYSDDVSDFYEKGKEVGVVTTDNKDINALRELLIYGIKGMAAYAHHAHVLDKEDEDIYSFMISGLAATTDDSLGLDDYLELVMKCGEFGVRTMALLDEANTGHYGIPEPTEVDLGVRDNPAILISGHDLKDMEQLLEQTEGTGVDVYTHGEMLPANAYPQFKKYDHLVGNYGGSWWKQKDEFEKFNGPILMTTNCLVPPEDSYKDRVYTTSIVGFEGLDHIEEKDGKKDFSQIIEHAKKCDSPEQLEEGSITIGFAHNSVLNVADKVVEAIKEGDIKHFFVMGGCDGRHNSREYYENFAKELPEDTVILTAGCAKYRYNKLDLGDIGGIPRVLDAGQCNDSYSLVVVAKKLAEVFDVDLNELPISYNIAWYEQKAVLVLLALLYLGVKKIYLGPTLPAFLSEDVVNVLVQNFDLRPNGSVEEDMEAMLG